MGMTFHISKLSHFCIFKYFYVIFNSSDPTNTLTFKSNVPKIHRLAKSFNHVTSDLCFYAAAGFYLF